MAFYAITKSSEKKTPPYFLFITVLICHLLLTSHNILSLLSIPVIVIYSLLLPEKKRIFTILLVGLVSAAYFFLPLIAESSLTYATYVATLTKFKDHFLCVNQLWQSPWGYGGSAPGCSADGMSFKLGKPQVLMSILGLCLYFWVLAKHNKKRDEKIILSVTGGFIILPLS